jgi:methylthioribose-1-phosphate isomerase
LAFKLKALEDTILDPHHSGATARDSHPLPYSPHSGAPDAFVCKELKPGGHYHRWASLSNSLAVAPGRIDFLDHSRSVASAIRLQLRFRESNIQKEHCTKNMIKTLEWTDEGVRMLDQRLLPTEEKYLLLRSYEEVAEAIKKMVVRGAPAIGVSAAMGLALGASQSVGMSVADLEDDFDYMCKVMSETRPTAVNLFWAIERMREALRQAKDTSNDTDQVKKALVREALKIFQEDIEANRSIGRYGAELIDDGATVLTHCNAGALATAGDYGTALGVIRGARDAGKRIAVIADETRPFLQGLRLTAWELAKDDIPVTVITDNMAGHVMKSGKVDAVVVGADRIAANGDTANKIGTYMVAVMARRHEIPFYVAAPISTLDLSLKSGEEIPIEERDRKEITHLGTQQLGPEGVEVHNPAFDITPNDLITAIITDKGVARAPYTERLQGLAGRNEAGERVGTAAEGN